MSQHWYLRKDFERAPSNTKYTQGISNNLESFLERAF